MVPPNPSVSSSGCAVMTSSDKLRMAVLHPSHWRFKSHLLDHEEPSLRQTEVSQSGLLWQRTDGAQILAAQSGDARHDHP
jgi:hypothetical protein